MVYTSLFFNRCFDKKRLKAFLLWSLMNMGENKTLDVVENLKDLGFRFATRAGISIGLDDLITPPSKLCLVSEAEQQVFLAQQEYEEGKLTAVEKFQRLVDTWHRTSETLKKNVIDHFQVTDILNPVYMMAFSGARGNISQVRQLAGMRGLMADPQGQIIEFPIRSNFREGLTLTEYMISCYGARKGLVDTAIRTADAGYLTRRLVDVSQHVIVKVTTCTTGQGIYLKNIEADKKILVSLKDRLLGRVVATSIFSKKGKLLAYRNQEISFTLATQLAAQEKQVLVRSALTCSARHGICQLCYGWSLSQRRLVTVGEAVGIIAAQSIGEPGTQLTMRTFHTGGVFSGDILNETRAPYDGIVDFSNTLQGLLIRTSHGKIAFLTKTAGEMSLQKTFFSNQSNNQEKTNFITDDFVLNLKKNQDQIIFEIQPLTILFVRRREKIFKDQLLAEFSSIESQTNEKIEAKKTVFSQLAGQISFMTTSLTKIFREDGSKTQISTKLNYLWILAGTKSPVVNGLKLYHKGCHVVDRRSLLSRVLKRSLWTKKQLIKTLSIEKNTATIKKLNRNKNFYKLNFSAPIKNLKNFDFQSNQNFNQKKSFSFLLRDQIIKIESRQTLKVSEYLLGTEKQMKSNIQISLPSVTERNQRGSYNFQLSALSFHTSQIIHVSGVGYYFPFSSRLTNHKDEKLFLESIEFSQLLESLEKNKKEEKNFYKIQKKNLEKSNKHETNQLLLNFVNTKIEKSRSCQEEKKLTYALTKKNQPLAFFQRKKIKNHDQFSQLLWYPQNYKTDTGGTSWLEEGNDNNKYTKGQIFWIPIEIYNVKLKNWTTVFSKGVTFHKSFTRFKQCSQKNSLPIFFKTKIKKTSVFLKKNNKKKKIRQKNRESFFLQQSIAQKKNRLQIKSCSPFQLLPSQHSWLDPFLPLGFQKNLQGKTRPLSLKKAGLAEGLHFSDIDLTHLKLLTKNFCFQSLKTNPFLAGKANEKNKEITLTTINYPFYYSQHTKNIKEVTKQIVSSVDKVVNIEENATKLKSNFQLRVKPGWIYFPTKITQKQRKIETCYFCRGNQEKFSLIIDDLAFDQTPIQIDVSSNSNFSYFLKNIENFRQLKKKRSVFSVFTDMDSNEKLFQERIQKLGNTMTSFFLGAHDMGYFVHGKSEKIASFRTKKSILTANISEEGVASNFDYFTTSLKNKKKKNHIVVSFFKDTISSKEEKKMLFNSNKTLLLLFRKFLWVEFQHSTNKLYLNQEWKKLLNSKQFLWLKYFSIQFQIITCRKARWKRIANKKEPQVVKMQGKKEKKLTPLIAKILRLFPCQNIFSFHFLFMGTSLNFEKTNLTPSTKAIQLKNLNQPVSNINSLKEKKKKSNEKIFITYQLKPLILIQKIFRYALCDKNKIKKQIYQETLVQKNTKYTKLEQNLKKQSLKKKKLIKNQNFNPIFFLIKQKSTSLLAFYPTIDIELQPLVAFKRKQKYCHFTAIHLIRIKIFFVSPYNFLFSELKFSMEKNAIKEGLPFVSSDFPARHGLIIETTFYGIWATNTKLIYNLKTSKKLATKKSIKNKNNQDQITPYTNNVEGEIRQKGWLRDKKKKIVQKFAFLTLKVKEDDPLSMVTLSESDHVTFLIQQQKPTVFVGQYVKYGQELAHNVGATKAGRVIRINNRHITLQKGQPIVGYSECNIHVDEKEWIEKNSPILTLTYQRLVTGDIVQGIPKIEQFFEAPATKEGEPFGDSLQNKLKQSFQDLKKKFKIQDAVKKSLQEVQEIIIEGIQRVYLSQGVLIADKHLEIIIRQMTCKGQIINPGDTGLFRNEYVNLDKIENINLVTYGQRADYQPAVLGITQASLDSESFISAASFQETTRVLSRDTVIGKTDFLRGLKERVILGDLIQAGTGLEGNIVYGFMVSKQKPTILEKK